MALAAVVLMATGADATELRATPADYRSRLGALRPGDVLWLEPGDYLRGLPVHGMEGTPEQPIVVRAADRAAPPRFLARPEANTVSIVDSAYVTIADLVLEGRGTGVDAVKAEGHARFAHHITLERLRISGHDANQQVVGISTKCPAWGWVVRDNRIDGAGTGMYFGNSDGKAPFVGGLIEGNRIRNTIGYNLQVKHQLARPANVGMPVEAQATVIRGNRFEKGPLSASGEMARPNVLVGHWPLTGPGSTDRYLVYGNVFEGNPGEALFQGEGNVALYNNLFVNRDGAAINIRPHNHLPRWIAIFHNTVIAATTGISVTGGEAGYEQRALGNAVFAREPVRGIAAIGNFTAGFDAVSEYLEMPFGDSGSRSLALQRALPESSSTLPADLARLPDAAMDFGGLVRREAVHGACVAGAMQCK
jgi:hypothetical protein